MSTTVVVGDDAVLLPRVVADLGATAVRPGAPLPDGAEVVVWLGPAAGGGPAQDPGGEPS